MPFLTLRPLGVTLDINEGFLRQGASDEGVQDQQTSPIHLTYREAVPQLQLSTTYACNMSCDYCTFRVRAKDSGKPTNMDRSTATRAVSFYSHEVLGQMGAHYGRIDFGLTGEPLLTHSLHNQLISIISQEFSRCSDVSVSAGPNVTNATLARSAGLVEEMGPPQDVSCDGPRDVHDRFRKYVNGGGTYDDVCAVSRAVLRKHPGMGVSAVLTALFPNFTAVFKHLHDDLGFRNIFMKPVNTSRDVPYGLDERTLPAFQEGYRQLVDWLLAQPAENLLTYLLSLSPEDYFMRFVYRIKDRQKLVYRCGAGKSGAYVDTSGKLYPCAHFIGKLGWEIGDIWNGLDLRKRDEFLALHVDNRQPCASCWARYLCGGGCYYQAVLANGDTTGPDEAKCQLVRYLCEQAIRLVSVLAEKEPAVLTALPTPVFIRREDLAKRPDHPYSPSVALKRQDTVDPLLLTGPGRMRGSLSGTNHLTATLQQSEDVLRVKMAWGPRTAVKRISIWILDPEAEHIRMEDLPLLKPGAKGCLLRLEPGSSARFCRLEPEGGNVRRVPYQAPVWTALTNLPVTCTPGEADMEIPLRHVIRDISESYGLNITVEFADGGSTSLILYEPYGVVKRADAGFLCPAGGEFLTSAVAPGVMNSYAGPGLEPLGRWLGIQPNVC